MGSTTGSTTTGRLSTRPPPRSTSPSSTRPQSPRSTFRLTTQTNPNDNNPILWQLKYLSCFVIRFVFNIFDYFLYVFYFIYPENYLKSLYDFNNVINSRFQLSVPFITKSVLILSYKSRSFVVSQTNSVNQRVGQLGNGGVVLCLSQCQVMTKQHHNLLLTLKVFKSDTEKNPQATLTKVQSKSLIHTVFHNQKKILRRNPQHSAH